MNLVPALKADRSHYDRCGRRQFGLPLVVVSQLALALVLVVCACDLLRSYLKTSMIDLGFPKKKNVLLVKHLQAEGTLEQKQAFFRDLVIHVQNLPGIKSVGLSSSTPLEAYRNGREYQVSLPGDKTSGKDHANTITGYIVDPGYFPTIGIPIVKGSNFSRHVSASTSPQVVVNETFATRFWPGKDPIGHFVQLLDAEDEHAPPVVAQVIGLVGDVRQRQVMAAPDPYLYVPMHQVFSGEMTLIVETRDNPHLLADPIRKIIQQLDPEMQVFPTISLKEEIDNLQRGCFADTTILGSLSLIGISLASIGLYGIVAFAVNRRTHELGIRMALGARRTDVVKTVMRQGVKLSLVGLVIGLMGSFLLGKLISAAMPDMVSFDFLTFAGASAILIGTALLACYLPARRAAKIDPMEALRYE